MKKSEDSWRDTDLRRMQEKEAESFFEEIMTKTFPNRGKETDIRSIYCDSKQKWQRNLWFFEETKIEKYIIHSFVNKNGH